MRSNNPVGHLWVREYCVCEAGSSHLTGYRSVHAEQGGAVLTGHEDGMVRAWTSDGSSGWKETDTFRWKVQVRLPPLQRHSVVYAPSCLFVRDLI